LRSEGRSHFPVLRLRAGGHQQRRFNDETAIIPPERVKTINRLDTDNRQARDVPKVADVSRTDAVAEFQGCHADQQVR